MAVVSEGELSLVRGVPNIFFTASEFPGIFGGKVDLNSLPDANDIIQISLRVKYSSSGAFVDAEDNATFQQQDKIARITPTEETYGYELTIELLAASPSSAASVEFVILRTDT